MTLALAIATPAFAQSDTATLQGHVDGASTGATVSVTDTHTGQRMTGAVDASGNYEIFGLRPSTYKVEVAGKAPQETTLLIGQTSVVDFLDGSREPPSAVEGRVFNGGDFRGRGVFLEPGSRCRGADRGGPPA
jgi:hypothetical protein